MKKDISKLADQILEDHARKSVPWWESPLSGEEKTLGKYNDGKDAFLKGKKDAPLIEKRGKSGGSLARKTGPLMKSHSERPMQEKKASKRCKHCGK